ncbi:MAG: rRNA maturation RNase YbeY [Actinobacteria bacterium]|nr:rRNA maturation RNase YbeY [Actinomycetota bacterium]
MTIEITNKSGALAPGDQIQSLLAFAMSKLDLNPDCDLNVTFVDDAEMTELHIKWMDEPGSTDVLSFPMDLPETEGEIVTLGDIVISPDFATAQANLAGHSPEHEMFILATHGLLHILGYDHAEAVEEKVMFELQESLVKQWSAESK